VRAPGLQCVPSHDEDLYAACPHAANQLFLNRLLGSRRRKLQPKEEVSGEDPLRDKSSITVKSMFENRFWVAQATRLCRPATRRTE